MSKSQLDRIKKATFWMNLKKIHKNRYVQLKHYKICKNT